ncbi:MAG: hypothetical protein JNJ57_22010 [Saprospiraceae bacterium]|nr:hypothetical protein [Saprospiraceae bacterium]
MKTDETTPTPSEKSTSGLWLTSRMMDLLAANARIGVHATILATIAGLLAVILSVATMWWVWTQYADTSESEAFYLLEGDNLYKVVQFLLTFSMFFTYFKGVLTGFRAFKQLKRSAEDDEALLEGSERLWKTLYWLTLWIAIYAVSAILEYISLGN